MQDRTITIIPDEKSVTVGGETFIIPGLDWPSHVHMLMWEPKADRLKGYISQAGDAYRFDGFDQFEPYVAAWKDAKAKDDAEKAKAAQEAEAAEKEREAAAKRAEAEQRALIEEAMAQAEKQRPIAQAQAALASTDFKIIKAMEAKLIAEGAIDVDLVAKREAARQAIRDGKA
jgi:hypothetical protein